MVTLLEDTHTDALQKTNCLQDILTNLCYEGKAAFGRNLKETKEVLKFFDEEMREHIDLEDEIIFPFLETHIPKLEPAIHLLQAEHEDYKKNLEGFKFLIQELPKKKYDSNRGQMLERLKEQGIYLIYLLRNHIQAENKSIYRAIKQELRPREKSELERQMAPRGAQRR